MMMKIMNCHVFHCQNRATFISRMTGCLASAIVFLWLIFITNPLKEDSHQGLAGIAGV